MGFCTDVAPSSPGVTVPSSALQEVARSPSATLPNAPNASPGAAPLSPISESGEAVASHFAVLHVQGQEQPRPCC